MMFLMWIVPLLLIGLFVYAISGNNLMKKVNWLIVGIVGFIFLLFLFGGGMMSGWGYSGWGMMGGWGNRGWGMGPGMMGGWSYSPFGWIGMIFMWLISLGFVVLIALGVAWLVRNLGNSMHLVPQSVCPQCNQSVQQDWKNCPHCGRTL